MLFLFYFEYNVTLISDDKSVLKTWVKRVCLRQNQRFSVNFSLG